MKGDSTEANDENEEEMFHSDAFVSFVVFCRGFLTCYFNHIESS